jgi:hypothetical protein
MVRRVGSAESQDIKDIGIVVDMYPRSKEREGGGCVGCNECGGDEGEW